MPESLVPVAPTASVASFVDRLPVRRLISAAAVLALAGCSLAPTYQRPELPVGGFTAGVAIVAGGLLLVWRRPRAARTAVPVRTDGPAAAVER